jgi:hypothetical protein
VTLVSSTTNCATGGFCIQGAVSGVGPTAGRTLGLTLINPNLYPIFVTSVTVKANDTSGCPGSATIASPGWSSKDTSPIPTDSIPVPPASSFGPGQATTSVTVSWTDSKTTNQTGCLGVSVPLTYGGRALWYGSCITRQQSGLSIAPGAVACVGAGGKISGGVTVPSGAGLVLDPGAVVSGGVNATGGATEIMFCSASVSGGVTVSKATGPVVIGNGSYCGGNTISGGLTVTHNTGGVTTLGNSVSGPTNVSNNSGSVPAP